jgi:hypothetical protein
MELPSHQQQVAGGVPPGAEQWSPEHFAALQAAHVAGRKIRRAARVAAVDGWTIVVFGALTMLLGIGDVSTIVIGAVMVMIGAVEVKGGARLKKLDAGAARVLGWNQVVLGSLLLAYAVWRLVTLRHGGAGADMSAILGTAGADPDVKQMLGGVEELARQIMLWVYLTVAAVAVAGPGVLAWYYFSRARHVRAYLERTPPWIVEMQRAGVVV